MALLFCQNNHRHKDKIVQKCPHHHFRYHSLHHSPPHHSRSVGAKGVKVWINVNGEHEADYFGQKYWGRQTSPHMFISWSRSCEYLWSFTPMSNYWGRKSYDGLAARCCKGNTSCESPDWYKRPLQPDWYQRHDPLQSSTLCHICTWKLLDRPQSQF